MAKSIHHILQRRHLINDGAGRTPQHLGIRPGEFVRQLHLQALRRELNRRQRVLDLVGEAARHLGPCGVALRLQHMGDVIKHQYIPGGAAGREAGPTQEQHLFTFVPAVTDLLFPLAAATGTKRSGNFSGQRSQPRHPFVPSLRLKTGELVDDGIKNRIGTIVVRTQPHAVVEGEHPGRQVIEDALHVGMGVSKLRLITLHNRTRLGQLLAHAVKRLHQDTQLILARNSFALAEIALRHRPRALRQKTQRRGEAFAQDKSQ